MTTRLHHALALGASLAALACCVSAAQAEPLSPWFHLRSAARPGNLIPGEPGQVVVTAVNVGDASADASSAPLVITDTLPEHVIPQNGGISLGAIDPGAAQLSLEKPCEIMQIRQVTCTFNAGSLPPFHQIEIVIAVTVQETAASGSLNEASLAGAGAPSVQAEHPLTISGAPTPFGVEDYEALVEEPGGQQDTQAGSHPFQYTTAFDLKANLTFSPEKGRKVATPAQLAKDVVVKLPPGLVGNPTAYPRCPLGLFLTIPHARGNLCPLDTIVGVASVTIAESGTLSNQITGLLARAVPIYDVEPGPGEPARFGFAPNGVPVLLDTSVRTGGDYGVTVTASDISQAVGFLSNTVTFWGVPADARHDNARAPSCLEEEKGDPPEPSCEPDAPAPPAPAPLLTLPTSCSGAPLQGSVETDSWLAPGAMVSPTPDPSIPLPTLDGCDLLPFHAAISVAPDVESSSTPSGIDVDVHVPQDEALNANGLTQASVKNIAVTLPEGLVLNPSSADGLQACSLAQIGFAGEDPETHTAHFSAQEPSCPDASKIATVTIKTPLLPPGQYVKGFVYLASPQNFREAPPANPFSSLLAMYIVAKDPVSGVLVKLPAKVALDETTGQISTTVEDNPQLPFEDAELHFFGGERAPLATPAHCGAYTTSATFEPWSNTPIDHTVLHSSSTFNVTRGPGGSACPASALPFAPSLSSETTNVNAGSFTPLSTTLGREDGNQDIQKVTLHYPPGVSGILSGIPLCPQAQANAGTCGPESLIGETVVSVGLGGDPFSVTGGKVYLTEGYAGAPFGLSIVNPASAGPFILQQGKPVIVRAKVEIDPHTAALTVTTDPIPRILEGFPLAIKHVNVTVNRPGFTFNPTDCDPLAVTGAVDSYEGASVPVSVPFQVANCARLRFAPQFSVSVTGRTSKLNGAGLSVKLAYPPGSLGTQANIGHVKVELPKQLPSRLPTLQQACLAGTFDANRSACPPGSVVGHAKVTTPLLPVPLEGPAYFVSHGSAEFPDLTIVLRGYGVTVELVGKTFISKSGITSTTFKTPPDVPFNTFELTLPQGRYSALAANANLCSLTRAVSVRKRIAVHVHGRVTHRFRSVLRRVPQPLLMPSEFVGQNGALMRQSTKIRVTGCSRSAPPKHRHKGRARKRRHKP